MKRRNTAPTIDALLRAPTESQLVVLKTFGQIVPPNREQAGRMIACLIEASRLSEPSGQTNYKS